jgi:hypothetical protein
MMGIIEAFLLKLSIFLFYRDFYKNNFNHPHSPQMKPFHPDWLKPEPTSKPGGQAKRG